jgi:hypothetical protein
MLVGFIQITNKYPLKQGFHTCKIFPSLPSQHDEFYICNTMKMGHAAGGAVG